MQTKEVEGKKLKNVIRKQIFILIYVDTEPQNLLYYESRKFQTSFLALQNWLSKSI